MAPSFDYAMSSLFCAEDNASIFDDVDVFEDCNSIWKCGNLRNFDQNQNFFGILQSDECISSLFEKERQHFCGFDYFKRLKCGDLDLVSRNEAVYWIQKVQSHYNFGPLCLYLSVNYLDRFLSTYELPKGKAWMMQLLAVACLSIAAKMDETDVPLSLDLQVCGSKYVFEAKTIQRMELLVMSTLNWRMQFVTPFSFIDYFLFKLCLDQVPPPCLIFQAIELIICSIKEIELLQFKASEIAASVAISVTQETQTVKTSDNESFPSFFPQQLHKESVMKCVEMMHAMRLNSKCNGESDLGSTSMPQSPIGVLDASCLSYKSDDFSTVDNPFWSCANSDCDNSDFGPKRRKLDNNVNFKLQS
ncbi:hypothetical protein RND81_03G237200 [Saponaria officinalis]|uniref:B-like cyclin n=1 Tax=Saponaria officinalis TaxID=3572 RepID=A0AAW1MCG7_SAPOF